MSFQMMRDKERIEEWEQKRYLTKVNEIENGAEGKLKAISTAWSITSTE